MMMNFYSTNNPNTKVAFQQVVFASMPLDKGLYMPENIPQMSADFLQNLPNYSLQEMALQVAHALIGDAIPVDALQQIVAETLNFELPLVPMGDDTFVLELFHGPSAAFKDFGARFMSRVMAYFLKEGEVLLDVLVATSGDTGGAVALGFLGVKNTRVTILYPKGKVSPLQELQLTSNGKNIRAIAIAGTFDDCQALVKQAFADRELAQRRRLTSANSINIARLIPQSFYYFYTMAQLQRMGYKEVVFAVPSGNFGNIGAGILAHKMGLPVQQFIAATNVNDTVPRFLETGSYEARPSQQTYANAMDVGAPSNWVRIMALFKGDLSALKDKLSAYAFTDAETLEAMRTLYQKYNYIACPHTAIAYLGSAKYKVKAAHTAKVFLSTAHPSKFMETFDADMQALIEVPQQMQQLADAEKIFTEMPVDFECLKQFLLAS